VISPSDHWHQLLRPEVELAEPFWREFAGRMRDARLTFGDRLNCPFLRPFFLTEHEAGRVTHAAETIARVGEKVVAAALSSAPSLLDDLALSAAERTLASYEPGYARASTASRLDAFLLPDSLSFAEYNAESPAGLGYTENLAELFNALPVMDRFRERFSTRFHGLSEALLKALIESYREWGGTAAPPTMLITDFREVPTWSEFLILQERFARLGVPTEVCDPRDLAFDGAGLFANGRRIDLVYRRVLINDLVERPEDCRALVDAYKAGVVCVANTFRCKIPHKKTFFAVLTDDRYAGLFTAGERDVIRQHVPWTRVLADTRTTIDGTPIELLAHVREQRESFVIKPSDEYGGSGVTLGWETPPGEWDAAIQRALGSGDVWIAQRRIAVRREVFPIVERDPHRVAFKDMLVDFAPYIFRGRVAGFLTRLSATGLANVTSGGGQVPSFVVSPAGDAASSVEGDASPPAGQALPTGDRR
jgi:uncharacterized circularly permuted ATP-grasp superfamily protein